MNSTLPIPHKIKFEKSSLALKLEKEYGKAWIVEQYSLFDLYYSLQACIEQDIKIKPFTREIIKTGFYLQIDDPYTYLEIISDSNLVYEKGLIVLDAPTYFGHGFRNEIFLILYNTTDKIKHIGPYERIAMFQSKTFNKTSFEYIYQVEEVNSTKTGKKWIQIEKGKQV